MAAVDNKLRSQRLSTTKVCLAFTKSRRSGQSSCIFRLCRLYTQSSRMEEAPNFLSPPGTWVPWLPMADGNWIPGVLFLPHRFLTLTVFICTTKLKGRCMLHGFRNKKIELQTNHITAPVRGRLKPGLKSMTVSWQSWHAVFSHTILNMLVADAA